jgi:hypothetical protein
MLENSLHADPSAERQTVQHWPADGDGIGSERECLKHILTSAYAAID